MGVADRITLADARHDRLYFAQVREDPLLEIEALAPTDGQRLVVVGSGGCTALSLLAAGAGRVVAVDLNPTQNSLTELKAVALDELGPERAMAFLGGASLSGARRGVAYEDLKGRLSPAARQWWDGHQRAIERSVLDAGVTERFIAAVTSAIRLSIHPPGRIRRLLQCRTLEDQRRFYDQEWNTRRWRLMFDVLLNRAVFRKAYQPAFFAHVDNPSFARHFRTVAAHTLTEVPVVTNYFVHHMLTHAYPQGVPGGVPPYLDPEPVGKVAPLLDRLTLVDGGYTSYLRSLPDRSVHGFAISNILEWFSVPQIDELFAEVVRTAVPGARLVFRNFVGWTEVPESWQAAVVEDRALGEALIAGDRSAVQRRIAVCRIEP